MTRLMTAAGVATGYFVNFLTALLGQKNAQEARFESR
jgi:hypothetical protein